ncbi:uncharacterized protein [Odocoileus virginianus]|uniref:Exocyst complex component 3-like protein n=1 Tax=Odocoileus virginianus TaxID=9874 RepID=A0A6J0Z7H9_ODOVR
MARGVLMRLHAENPSAGVFATSSGGLPPGRLTDVMMGSEGDHMKISSGETLCPSAPVWPLDLGPKGSSKGRLVFLPPPLSHRPFFGSFLPGFSQLLLEGRFLEACRSISSLAEDGQDRGSQYQMVAQGMWQVIREALEGGGGSQELQRKLRSVAATVEWARGSSRELGDDLASWDCQLRTQLRNDAENRVPPSPGDRVPLSPGDQLGGYLAELARAVDRGLDPQRAGWLGARLSAIDRECFQEVLLDRLSMLLTCSGDPDSCRELYTWARKTLFGQLTKTPEPAATRKLSDPLMFVTWMSQVQSRLVELVQKELEKQLEDVLTCDQKESATSSCQAFLKIFQLLKGTIDSVQDIGPPITSRVQAMVLNTFSEFLKRYRGEGAPHFLQQQAGAGPSPQLHVLQNCCVLRKTWQSLGQAHTPLADVVLRTISAIEDRSQDDLVSVVRSQYRVMYPQLQPLRGPSAAPNGVARGCLCLPGSLQPRTMRGVQQSPGTASFELPASSLLPARAWALVCSGRTAQLPVWPETGPVQLRGLGLALPPLRRPGSTLTEGSCLGRVHVCSLSTGRPALGSV